MEQFRHKSAESNFESYITTVAIVSENRPNRSINSLRYALIAVAPVIREQPKVIRIEKKRSVVVECHVESQFEPTVMWYKEQTVVQKNSTHKVNIQKVSEVRTIDTINTIDRVAIARGSINIRLYKTIWR